MIYCFDTIAINQLCDDSERQAMVLGMLTTNSVYVTAVNCIEVLATDNPLRCNQLHSLLNELARGQTPLALPMDLLKILTICYAEGQNRPRTRDLTYGLLVDDYFILDRDKKEGIIKFKTRWEESFYTFSKVRPSFEKVFTLGNVERPSSLPTLIRDHYREEAFLRSIMQDLYNVTGQTLPPDRVDHLLESIPEWKVVLLGLAYASYTRSVQSEGYGRKGKAGAIDLWSSTYLTHCDIFVTHDFDHYKAFRFGNRLNPRRTRIQRYSEFRSRLLVG